MLVFDNDIGAALDRVCDQDSNSEAVHLAHLHRHMFNSHCTITGSFCQERSVPCTLAAFTSKYGVGRPKYQGPTLCEFSTPAVLSIAQNLKYNSVKHMRNR